MGYEATTFGGSINNLIALKGVRIGNFKNIKNLGTVRSTRILFNSNIPEALRQFEKTCLGTSKILNIFHRILVSLATLSRFLGLKKIVLRSSNFDGLDTEKLKIYKEFEKNKLF